MYQNHLNYKGFFFVSKSLKSIKIFLTKSLQFIEGKNVSKSLSFIKEKMYQNHLNL